MLFRRQKDGFNAGIQRAIHAYQLEFVFKVSHCAQSAQDHAGTTLAYKVDQQRVKRTDLYIRQMTQHLPGQLDTALRRQGIGFLSVDADGHNNVLEQARGTLYQISVPIGNGIECAWVNRCFHTLISTRTLNGAYTTRLFPLCQLNKAQDSAFQPVRLSVRREAHMASGIQDFALNVWRQLSQGG